MPNELDPIRGQWYAHLNKGQRFFISAIDEDGGTVEIQHFDGDLEEATFEECSAGVAKRQTASVYLKLLCDLGVLKEIKSGRENIFVHPKYIELLTGEENVWVYYSGVETDSVESG